MGAVMERKGIIASLTSLRFFASFAIVLHHSKGLVLSNDFLDGVPLSSGVSFFFVLSGFILAYVYSDKMASTGLYKFYAGRFARIWPVHIFTLLLVMILLPAAEWTYGAEWGWLVTLLNAMLFQSIVPVPAYYFSFNGVSWSISTEMFFYILFPLLLAGLSKNWHIKMAGLLLLGGLSVYVLDMHHGNYYSPEKLTAFSGHGLAYINPLFRVQEFFIGILVFKLFDFIKGSSVFGSVSCTTFEVLCIAVLAVGIPKAVGYAYAISGAGNSGTAEFWSHCATGLIFGVVVLVFGINKGWVSKFLGHRIFIVLGEISFSMYLVHQVVFRFYNAHRSAVEFIPAGVMYAALLVIVFVMSYGMWRIIEMPLQTRFKRFFDNLRVGAHRPKTPAANQ